MQAVIFIGSGKISYGKLSQALEHGGADGADRRRLRRRPAPRAGSVAGNSASTWSTASTRSGSKGRRRSCCAILEALRWEVPDWIVVPGGNLGNVVAVRQGVRRAEASSD